MLDVQGLEAQVSELLRDSVRQNVQGAPNAVTSKDTEVSGDVVTETDFAIQDILQTRLPQLLPGSAFIGEEGFEAVEALTDTPHWIVDPLDGTLNFASGLPFFGASVALIENGSPVLGVVYDYSNDDVFEATAGQGARINGTDFKWNSALAARSPVGISSGYLARMVAPKDEDGPDYNAEWLGHRFRILGSQAVQLCWAAQGRLKLNINCEAKLWDDAAGVLICQEAGADYEAADSAPLYPLRPNSPALAGKSLFSISGTPTLVEQCRQEFMEG